MVVEKNKMNPFVQLSCHDYALNIKHEYEVIVAIRKVAHNFFLGN